MINRFYAARPEGITQVKGFTPIGMVECWNIGHAVKL